jgi:hypothetical protein
VIFSLFSLSLSLLKSEKITFPLSLSLLKSEKTKKSLKVKKVKSESDYFSRSHVCPCRMATSAVAMAITAQVTGATHCGSDCA